MGLHNFLSIRDFSSEEILYLLELASEIKRHPSAHAGALKGKTLAMIFEKPSLRTRVSFDVGIQQLGGFALYLSNAEISLGKRESLYDVAKNLERMVQAIMIRTYAHEIVEQMAEYASIPVINGLTDFSHPCKSSPHRTTGTPPPPHATTSTPSLISERMTSSSTISTGSGDGTTRRYPRAASSTNLPSELPLALRRCRPRIKWADRFRGMFHSRIVSPHYGLRDQADHRHSKMRG